MVLQLFLMEGIHAKVHFACGVGWGKEEMLEKGEGLHICGRAEGEGRR